MRKCTLGMGALLLAFMLGPPGKLSAGTSTISMQLTGVSQSLGNYYVAPYQISVGGKGPYGLICDDAQDDITMGESWTATTETFSNLTGALFLNGSSQQLQTYEEAGYLVNQIITNNNLGTTAGYLAAAENQYALWDLFTPGFSSTYGGIGNDEQAVESDLSAAATNYASTLAFDQNLVIYTPSPNYGPGHGDAQEFFGYETPQAPEPMTLWSLLVVLAAIALAYKWVGKTTTVPSTAAGM